MLSPRLDSLKKTLQNPAKLPGQIEIHSPANGDIYVYHENELYYVQKDKLLQISIKTRSDHKSQEACLGNSYLIQLWKNNEAKIWENGTAIDAITKIQGDIENNADYLAGKYKLLWCETERSYIQAKNFIASVLNKNSSSPVRFLVRLISQI